MLLKTIYGLMPALGSIVAASDVCKTLQSNQANLSNMF